MNRGSRSEQGDSGMDSHAADGGSPPFKNDEHSLGAAKSRPDLVADESERRALSNSRWVGVISLSHPPEIPRLLPSAMDVVSSQLAGRGVITLLGRDAVHVTFRVQGSDERSQRFVQLAALHIAETLNFPASSIELAAIDPMEGSADDLPMDTQTAPETDADSRKGHLRLV